MSLAKEEETVSSVTDVPADRQLINAEHRPSYQEVLACSFSQWYRGFRSVTYASRVIEVPPEFVTYLLDDGPLFLPSGCDVGRFANTEEESESDNEEWTEESREAAEWDDHDSEPNPQAHNLSFGDFETKIQNAIRSLGGAVFPKLNWSAPRDVSWMSATGNLKCTTPSDIFILLKSSDFVMHDLTMPYHECSDKEAAPPLQYELVLRNWIEMIPGFEFRCFVHNNLLFAISQRDSASFYEYLPPLQDSIKQTLVHFFLAHIRGQFPNLNYCFDAYFETKDRVRLVDFNPYSAVTDPLLFTWDELHHLSVSIPPHSDPNLMAPELRVVGESSGIQPSVYAMSRLPRDVIDLASPEGLQELARRYQESQLGANTSSEDEDEIQGEGES